MAIIQMWPQNQGLKNSISFDGRTYSSVPGVSIPVPDFDAPVLQANGWTAYATIAGKVTITMLPPAGGGAVTISFEGRQYSAAQGVTVEALPFDAPILQANGWTLVQGQGVTLQTLTLSANSFTVGAAQGTLVGNVQNTAAGSAVTFSSLSVAGSLQLVNVAGTWQVQVGPSAPGSPGTLTFALVETLAGAANSPNTTSGLAVTETAAGSNPILQLLADMSQAFPMAA
ncbi:MAG: hypothetical protein WBW81_07355 [Methylocella sp.]